MLLNQLKWILDKLFRILGGRYQPMHLYLRASFSSPTQASFFFIYVSDSAGMGYCPHIMPRPGTVLQFTDIVILNGKQLFTHSLHIIAFLSQSWSTIKNMAAINIMSLNKTDTQNFPENACLLSGYFES